MSIGGYIRRTLFWANDKICGSRMKNAYDEILQINGQSKEENREYLQKRLNNLLKHAHDTTEYYREFSELNLQRFPVINKQTIIENREQMSSKVFRGQKLHEMHTSGSTGIPFVIQQNSEKRMRVIAEIKAMNEYTNYPSHEKMMYITGNARGKRRYSKWQEFRENIYRIGVGVWNKEKLDEMISFIQKNHPHAVYSSACNFYPVISYINDNEIKLNASVRTIITGGEMVPAKLRIELKDTFGDQCKIFVLYSNEEMGYLGIDAGIGTAYRLNWSDYYFEILKMDSDEPCSMGELGRIVVTDLFNYAVPMIRYDTGDIGAFGIEEGRIVLISLNGKKRDLLYDVYGNAICGATITNLLKNIKNVKMYQLIQETETEYTFKIATYDAVIPTDEDILLGDLKLLLGGEKANITVKFTDEIPVTNSQKRRYTVNNYRS